MACGDFGVVSTSAPGHPPGLSVCLLSGFMCWPHTIQFLSSTCAVTCSFVSCPVHVYLPYTCAALSFIYFTFAWPRLPGHGLPLPTQNDCAGVEEVMDGLQITYLFFYLPLDIYFNSNYYCTLLCCQRCRSFFWIFRLLCCILLCDHTDYFYSWLVFRFYVKCIEGMEYVPIRVWVYVSDRQKH